MHFSIPHCVDMEYILKSMETERSADVSFLSMPVLDIVTGNSVEISFSKLRIHERNLSRKPLATVVLGVR